MDLSIIIVSYNVRSFLRQALQTLLDASKGLETEIFVVDNNSIDGSKQMVRREFPEVKLICNPDNAGFARANNQALSRCKGRYILLINPDTIVRPDTLQKMVDFLDEHPEAGAAGCKILNPDGSLQLSCHRGFPTPRAALLKLTGLSTLFPHNPRFASYNLSYLDPDQVHEVDVLSGSFMMVRREAVEQVGPLDERFFLYGEDIDWCYRIKKAGWKLFYAPVTEIVHFKGESAKRAPRLKSTIAFYKAMHIFVRKHFGSGCLPLPGWLLSSGIALYAVFAIVGRLIERLLVPLADFLLVNLGLWVALSLRFRWVNWPQAHLPSFSTQQWLTVFLLFSSIWLVSFYLIGLYDKYKYRPWRALTGVFVGFAGIIFLVFFLPSYHFSRLVILYSWGLNSLLVAGWRAVAWWILKARKSARLRRQKVLILGTQEDALYFLNLVRQHPELNYEILGFVGDSYHPEDNVIEGVSLLGTTKNLPEILKECKVDEIIVTAQTVPYSQLLSLGSDSKNPNVHFKLLPISFKAMIAQRQIRRPEDLPLIDISYPPRWSLKRLWREISS